MWEYDLLHIWEYDQMGKECHRWKIWAKVKTYFGELYQDLTHFSRSTAGKQAKLDRTNNIEGEATKIEKEENRVTLMFDMMHQKHKEKINQIKGSNKQTLEMAQQSIKKKSEQMTAMYNNLQEAEKENDNNNKDKRQLHQRKKPVH